jgi:protein-L-isoaspartate(D-aspartate) O-methyltransferase
MTDTDLHAARINMVRRQLSGRDISDRRVLAAMSKVPRELFIPPEMQKEAYADRALSINCGQTISQPYIVALMTEVLELSGRDKVLEIGTGSGYQTAILAEITSEVVTIERHELLSWQAGKLLHDLGYQNVSILVGDGSLGLPALAPYDRIMVTAMAAQCPPALFEQLREGGIIVIPIGDYEHQDLQVIKKKSSNPEVTILTGCRFVPLIGEQGWSED